MLNIEDFAQTMHRNEKKATHKMGGPDFTSGLDGTRTRDPLRDRLPKHCSSLFILTIRKY